MTAEQPHAFVHISQARIAAKLLAESQIPEPESRSRKFGQMPSRLELATLAIIRTFFVGARILAHELVDQAPAEAFVICQESDT
jgi:hypothetical protein